MPESGVKRRCSFNVGLQHQQLCYADWRSKSKGVKHLNHLAHKHMKIILHVIRSQRDPNELL